MAYVFGYNLTPYSERIIEFLMTYRGMTAKQLTAMMHAPFSYNLSEEKSVYNYLRKLKKQGLVVAIKLQTNIANGSIYYLSPKGYDYAKDMLNIEEERTGTGWIKHYREFEESNFGDISYDLHMPPLKQLAHHLMLIDFFIELNMIDEDTYDVIKHRNNLYSSKTYFVDGKKNRCRPDAEIVLGNNRFAIEIDRATESHEQLLQKFETYRQYLDRSNDPAEKIDGIIFIVENKRRDHGIKRRWTNILSAFFKTMYKHHNNLNLIMTTLDAAKETLLFELKRNSFESEAFNEIEDILKSKGYSNVVRWKDNKKGELVLSHAVFNKKYHIFFNAISQEFESRLYSRYFNFLNKLDYAKEKEQVSNLEFAGYKKLLFYDLRKPYIVDKTNFLDGHLSSTIAELSDSEMKSFNEHLNFSLFE